MNNIFAQPTDQDALRLTHAIALQESGQNGAPNYNAVGDAGTSHGAYQWQPGNFESAAKEYGLDPNDKSPMNQDKVAYAQVKAMKDRGLDPGQIASSWNSGSPNNWKDHKGVTIINGKSIPYDTPAYVQGVQNQYKKLMGTTPQVSQSPQTTQSQDQTLGQELTGRGTQAATALGQAGQGISKLTQGDVLGGATDIGSGALQTAGAAAGAVGDIAQKGLEMIPGVKSLESGLGTVLGGLANTSTGKQIIGSVNDFVKAHPEAAANIGAVANIASVIPMFKAASLAIGAGKDALGMAMKGSLTKAAGNEIEGVAMKTVGGREALSLAEKRGLDPIKTILESDALPAVETDAAGTARYVTKDAFDAMSTQPEEDALQYALKSAPMVEGGQMSLDASRKSALKAVAKEFENRTDYDAAVKETNAIFDSYESRFGKNVFLSKVNDLKRGVRESVNFNSPKLQSDIHYIIGQSLMDDVETGAKRLEIKGVDELNKKMAAKIQAKKLLKLMDGSKVKVGTWGKWARKIKMATGAATGGLIGTTLGMPTAGAIAGTILESGAAQAPRTALERLMPAGSRVPLVKSLAKTSPLLLTRQKAPKQ